MKQPEPVILFLSYAHEDEVLCRELEVYLNGLKHRRLISIWHDRQLTAGTEWARTIDAHLERASIILLLLSPHFLASGHCCQEAQRAWQRHQAKEARIVPIIIGPCSWEQTFLACLQCLPPGGKPVTEWDNQHTAWSEVVIEIDRVVEEFVDVSRKKPEEVPPLLGQPVDVENLSEKAEPRLPIPLISQRTPSPRKRAIPQRLFIGLFFLLIIFAVVGGTIAYNLLKPLHWTPMDASFGNWEQNAGCLYQGLVYRDQLTKWPGTHICQMQGSLLDNVNFGVQMQIQRGDCGGIVFRANVALGHYYDLLLCPSGQDRNILYVYLKKLRALETNPVAISVPEDLYTDASQNSYTVGVKTVGSNLQTFINGKSGPQLSDSEYPSGSIGVITVRQSKSADVSFSNPTLLVGQ